MGLLSPSECRWEIDPAASLLAFMMYTADFVAGSHLLKTSDRIAVEVVTCISWKD